MENPNGVPLHVLADALEISSAFVEMFVRIYIREQAAHIDEHDVVRLGRAESGSVTMLRTILFEGPKREEEVARGMGLSLCALHEFLERTRVDVTVAGGMIRSQIRSNQVFAKVFEGMTSVRDLAQFFACSTTCIDIHLQELCMDGRLTFVDRDGYEWMVPRSAGGRMPQRLIDLSIAQTTMSSHAVY